MSKKPQSSIGYKNPPKHTQYEKGQSGNPDGRPKGSKNKRTDVYARKIEAMFLSEINREIPAVEDGNAVKMPILQAGMRAMAVKAAKGDVRANIFLLNLATEIEEKRIQREDERFEILYSYKVQAEDEIQSAKKQGKEPPKFAIHPEDIIIDYKMGTIDFIGPLTESQRESRRWLKKQKAILLDGVRSLQDELVTTDNAEDAEMLKEDIKRSEKYLELISEAVPE